MSYKTRVKTVRSGDRLEIIRYKEYIKYGSPPPNTGFISKPTKKTEVEKVRNRWLSSRRSKKTFTRLVYANINQWLDVKGKLVKPTFLTLTFKENIKNVKQANLEFTKFIKRLTYEITGQKKSFFKYITVIEFQDRGAIHYHCIFFNLSYLLKKRIAEIWGKGFIKIKRAKDTKKTIDYLAKYMGKELSEDRLRGEKSYFCSRDLKQPVISRNEERINFLTSIYKEDFEKVKDFSKDYTSDFCGEFNFSIYDLDKNKNLKKEILAFEELFGLN